MAPRQHNAATIHFGLWANGLICSVQTFLLDQSPSARRTPVGDAVGGKQGVAMAADAFHG